MGEYTEEQRAKFIARINDTLLEDPLTRGRIHVMSPDDLSKGKDISELYEKLSEGFSKHPDFRDNPDKMEALIAGWQGMFFKRIADEDVREKTDQCVVAKSIGDAETSTITLNPDMGYDDPYYVALIKADKPDGTYQKFFGLNETGELAVDLSNSEMEGEFFHRGGIYHELGHSLVPYADAKQHLAAQLEDPVLKGDDANTHAYVTQYTERIADAFEALMHLQDSPENSAKIKKFADIRAYSSFHRNDEEEGVIPGDRHSLRHMTTETLNEIVAHAPEIVEHLRSNKAGFAEMREMAIKIAERTNPSPQEFLEQSHAHDAIRRAYNNDHHNHNHGNTPDYMHIADAPVGSAFAQEVDGYHSLGDEHLIGEDDTHKNTFAHLSNRDLEHNPDTDTPHFSGIGIHAYLGPKSGMEIMSFNPNTSEAGTRLMCEFKSAIEKLTDGHAPKVLDTPEYDAACREKDGEATIKSSFM